MSQTHYTLRFISGKYQGGEFPLARDTSELVIGRASEADVVLVEDMVSRKHSRIFSENGALLIEDLESTNGTFVNGEKVQRAEIKEGDRILIGTSIFKLVTAVADDPLSGADARRRLEQQGAHRATNVSTRMTGIIEEIPLPDLIQLLSTSRKSGALVVHSQWGDGRIYFRKGQIYFASLEDPSDLPPRKVINRMLGWTAGTFSLEQAGKQQVANEITDSTEGLLMEGMRQMDEMKRLEVDLPRRSQLLVPQPLTQSLRELTPAELDLLQLAWSYGPSLQAILDRSSASDLATAAALKALVSRQYLVLKKP